MTRLALLAALLVAACAAVPPAAIPLDGLPATFEMGGRLSVAQSGRGEILRLRWSHAPAGDTWVLATPVGTEVVRIERGADGVVASRPGAQPVAATSFADLTENLLGHRAGVVDLLWWDALEAAGAPGDPACESLRRGLREEVRDIVLPPSHDLPPLSQPEETSHGRRHVDRRSHAGIRARLLRQPGLSPRSVAAVRGRTARPLAVSRSRPRSCH